MSEIFKRIELLIQLYQAELLGHLNILFAGDIETSDKIFQKRRELDIEIRNLLVAKIGKIRNKREG